MFMYEVEQENKIPILKRVRKFENLFTLNSPGKVVDFMKKELNIHRKAEEYAYMLAVDSANNLIAVFEVSHGGVNSAYLSPREIYVRALLSGAVGIHIIHNHPSGNPIPSKEDRDICRRISEIGKILNIEVLDFIIIGDPEYYSFRTEGRLLGGLL